MKKVYYIFYEVTIRGDQQAYSLLKFILQTVRSWELQVKNIINFLFYVWSREIYDKEYKLLCVLEVMLQLYYKTINLLTIIKI